MYIQPKIFYFQVQYIKKHTIDYEPFKRFFLTLFYQIFFFCIPMLFLSVHLQIFKLENKIRQEQELIENLNIIGAPKSTNYFWDLIQYWTFLYCSSFSFCSSNFAIANVVSLLQFVYRFCRLANRFFSLLLFI